MAGTEVALPDGSEVATGEVVEGEIVWADDEQVKAEIQQIIHWEKEADSLTGEADGFRAQAAGLIVKLLDSGATQRQVAEAINKSPSHVAHAAKAWRSLQEDTTIPDFNTAYKRAKRPDPPASAPEPQETEQPRADANQIEPDFPPWSKQMREATRLLAEMIDQANYKQTVALDKLLVKMTRANLTKKEDLEGAPGQT